MNLRPFIPLAISAAILIGAGALYGVGYYTLNNLTKKAASLESDIQTKTALLNRATRARTQLTSLESEEATINQYSVGKEQVVSFLEAVEGGGRALGSHVDVLSVNDQVVDGHSRISLSLSITGSFDAVMRTLGAIEYSPYDGVIESVNLDSTPTATGKSWTAGVIYSVGLRASSTPAKP